jgi:hypothetical protein
MITTLEMLHWGPGQSMVGIRMLFQNRRNYHAADRRNRMYWCDCFRSIRGVTGVSSLGRNRRKKVRYNQRFRPRVHKR